MSAGMIRCWFSKPSSAAVLSRAASRRPHSATTMLRCAASIAKARPIPEPAPVISTHFWSRSIAYLRARAKVVEDRPVQSVEDDRVVDDDALSPTVIEAIDELSEEADVFGVQRSVSSKIGKSGVVFQAKRRLHGVRDLVGQQDGHPLQDMHAAQECIGADMFDGIIGVSNHDPASRSPFADANRVGL